MPSRYMVAFIVMGALFWVFTAGVTWLLPRWVVARSSLSRAFEKCDRGFSARVHVEFFIDQMDMCANG